MKERNGLLIGNIVKFYNKEGKLDAGTIVDFNYDENRNEYAFVNTLDGYKIRIKVSDLIVIKHQRKGKTSENLKRKIKKELSQYNESQNSSAVPESTEVIKSTPESTKDIHDKQKLLETIRELEFQNLQLQNENIELHKKLESIPNGTTEERLANTIIALKKSILNGIIFPDDKSQAIIPLLDIITELNGIKHEALI